MEEFRQSMKEFHQEVNLQFDNLEKKVDKFENNIDRWFDKYDDCVSDFSMSIHRATYDFDVFKYETMSVACDDLMADRLAMVNQISSMSLATTLLPEARNPNVSFPVNNIGLKDTQVGGGLQKPLQRGQYQHMSNKNENKNQGGQSGYNHVEHSMLAYEGLSKQHCDGVQSKPLGGHEIPPHGRLKEKQHRKWQISLPHPPHSMKNQTRITTNTTQDGGGDHVEKSNVTKVGMNQQNPHCNLSPKPPVSGQGGKFNQPQHGVATPMLAGNKSSMIFGQGGKLNARKLSISRENSKDTKWFCDKYINQNNHMTVGKARKPQTQQRRNCVQLTKQDQSGQTMPHGRFDWTKTLENFNVPPRVKNTGDFLCHDPVAKMKPN
ncbi:unnamed protein product [Linum trigynum]